MTYAAVAARLFVDDLLVKKADGGNVVPGYSRTDCVPFTGDFVRHDVKWRNRTGIDTNRSLSLRFLMRNGDLYSHRFV